MNVMTMKELEAVAAKPLPTRTLMLLFLAARTSTLLIFLPSVRNCAS